MLIRAVVHARLFGVRLLTLDARVVVADSDPIEPALDTVVTVDPTVMPLARTHASDSERQAIRDFRARHHEVAPESARGVGHARDLLAQGTDTLAALRRPGR
jgi:hypothetical protein